MGPVRRYKDAQGHIFKLTDEDAKRRGGFTLVEKASKKAAEPAAEEAEKPEAQPEEKAAEPAANKARSAAPENKGR